MTSTLDKYIFGQVQLHIYRTSHKRSLCTNRQHRRREWLLDSAERRGLGYFAQLRGRGVLTFGQAVNLVVEQNQVQVDISAASVDKVVTTNRQRVAIA